MTSLGLLVGHPWSFLLIAITQWIWCIGFLFLVEEKELLEKFGEEYKAYRQQVPMLLPDPFCALRVLSQPIGVPK
jgi:protein-S-isoprenylcysteine O-methyltransferase Ste14